MGRKKLEIKKIEDRNSRQITFSKRGKGLIKKARDLSVLCDVSVAVIVFSSRGKLYEYCSADSLSTILKRYQRHTEAAGEIATSVHEVESKYSRSPTRGELLQIVEGDLVEPNVEELSVADLMQLEKQLDAALTQTRSRKNQLILETIVTLQEKERALKEENKRLQEELTAKVSQWRMVRT